MDANALNQGLSKALGFEFDTVGPDEVRISWTIGEQHLQPFDITHGGVFCSVNETAASVGGALWLGDRGSVVGVNNTTDFLRSSRAGDRLSATARPVHQGRSQQLWVIETVDAQGQLVARGQVRLQNLQPR